MRYRLLITTSLIGICGFFINLSCCDDCPTCPGDIEPPPLGNYRIYVLDGWNGFMMSIDTPADTVVDSIRLDYNGYGIFATPDGEKLLVTKTGESSMSIYDASDLSYIGSSPRYGDYFFDGGDNYGICTSFPDEKTYFIDPVSLMPIDSIEQWGYYSFLDTVINVFFIAGESAFYRIDCVNHELIDSIRIPERSTSEIAYNRCTNDLYFFESDLYWSYFHQYSIDAGAIVQTTYITKGGGGIAISPDCSLLYITESGNGMLAYVPSGNIMVFNTKSHLMKLTIPNFNFTTQVWVAPFMGEIILTPDDRRAYIGAGVSSGGGVPLEIVDLQENEIIKTIDPYLGFDATSIVLAPVPNM